MPLFDIRVRHVGRRASACASLVKLTLVMRVVIGSRLALDPDATRGPSLPCRVCTVATTAMLALERSALCDAHVDFQKFKLMLPVRPVRLWLGPITIVHYLTCRPTYRPSLLTCLVLREIPQASARVRVHGTSPLEKWPIPQATSRLARSTPTWPVSLATPSRDARRDGSGAC